MAEHKLMEELCNRDCPICLFQFWLTGDQSRLPTPHSIRVSDAHARDCAASLAQRAKADHIFIRDLLLQHGNAVEEVWVSSNAQQRAKIILEVQPDLYKKNYPQLRVFYGQDPCKQQNRRNAELLPYLNLSTLQADPTKLLGLLHHRSDQELEDWVMFDMQQIYLTLSNVGDRNPEYNENCVILHGERYGELVPWDQQAAHEYRMIGYMLAVHILEAQVILMDFLRRMLERILVLGCDLNGTDPWKSLTAVTLGSTKGNDCWSIRSDQAFSSAPTLSIDVLLAQAKTELRAALDHIRLLQTDPEYLQSLVATTRASHRALKISNEQSWMAQAMDLLCYPISDVINFTTLVVELTRASDILHKCKHRISLDRELPYNYKRALCVLYLLASNITSQYSARMAFLLCQTPGFRRHYHLNRPKGGVEDLTFANIQGRQHVYKESSHFGSDPLHFALFLLTARNPTVLPISRGEVGSFIEDHLQQAGQHESNRMTQLLYDHVSRHLVVSDLHSAIRAHRPGIHPICNPSQTEVFRGAHLSYCGLAEGLSDTSLQRLAQLLQDCCATRWPSGTRDQGWLQKAQAIRTKVSAFWALAREIRWAQFEGSKLSMSVIVKDVSLLAANRSDEHLKYLRNEIEVALAYEARIKAKVSEQSGLQTVWGEHNFPIKSHRQNTVEGVSVKKRGKDTNDKSMPENLPTKEDEQRTLVHVSRESLLLFAKVYPTATKAATKTTVKWTSFVAAMVDAGFTAIPTGGSAVHFNRNVTDGGGAIVFHKPHPDSTISPIMLQVMGKRLTKWFGWDKDVFVERSQDC